MRVHPEIGCVHFTQFCHIPGPEGNSLTKKLIYRKATLFRDAICCSKKKYSGITIYKSTVVSQQYFSEIQFVVLKRRIQAFQFTKTLLSHKNIFQRCNCSEKKYSGITIYKHIVVTFVT